MKRKQILILCVVLLTLLCAVILWRCCNKQATIAYYNPYTGVSFKEELTAEEDGLIYSVLVVVVDKVVVTLKLYELVS